MHPIYLIAWLFFGVVLLFAALCVLLAMATARIGYADDPEDEPSRPLWR